MKQPGVKQPEVKQPEVKQRKGKTNRAEAREYLRVVEWSQGDRCFVGSAPPLIGRCCHGPTEASVIKQLKQIVDEWIRLRDSDGVALPSPQASSAYSGRFILRVPPPVHQALALQAQAAGKSLNSYCAERLASYRQSEA